MDLLHAIILGIVQGATEFLPVSSSGHLVLVPWWLGWDVPSLSFSVAVHIGTLVAVLIYFRQDWIDLIGGALKLVQTRSLQDPHSRLFVWLVIGSIPVGVVGLLVSDIIDRVFLAPESAAIFLLGTAGLLAFAEWMTGRTQQRHDDLNTMRLRDAVAIGCAQVLALFPGVSRSGSTIAAGLLTGLSRTDAARFSFLLGTPAFVGAGLLTVLDYAQSGESLNQVPIFLAGAVSAGVVGYIAIAFLLSYLKQRKLTVFAVYCAVFGSLSLLAVLLGR